MNIPVYLEGIAPLLYSEWRGGLAKDQIIGNWAEDGGEYIINAPYPLVPFIIKMQNGLCRQVKKYNNYVTWANEINRNFKDIFG